MKIVAVIPARYASTRLPGKPLKNICGKPMVWWVYSKVKSIECIDQTVVATDDERIYKACKDYDIDVMMTADNHPTAIHRLYEVAEAVEGDVYLQVNGDEPLINEGILLNFVEEIRQTSLEGACGMNAISKMTDPVQVMDPANIKMVFNEELECCYMSRAPIPFPFKSLDYQYYKHIGLIAYTKELLLFFTVTTPGHFERVEGIDLLRFIDYGKKLHLIDVGQCETLSVDTKKDLEMVRKKMNRQQDKTFIGSERNNEAYLKN